MMSIKVSLYFGMICKYKEVTWFGDSLQKLTHLSQVD